MRKAKIEREIRAEKRLKNEAAVVIQKIWRGIITRKKLKSTLFNNWISNYGPIVSNTTIHISPHILLSISVLNLILIILKNNNFR